MNISTPRIQTGQATDWVEVLRPFSWTASIIPVGLGAVLAFREGAFSWPLFLPLLAGVVLLQGATNIVNEYYDLLSGIDRGDATRPSTVLAEKRISPCLALTAGRVIMGLFLLGAVCYATALEQWGILPFAVVAVTAGYFYTAPPLQYKYRGLGPPAVFLFFGIVLTQAVYYTLTGTLTQEVFWVSLPVSFLVSAILHGNDLRDAETDRGIYTIARVLGRRKAFYLYLVLIFAPYPATFISLLLGMVSYWSLLVFLTLPLAVQNARQAWAGITRDSSLLVDIDVKTARLHLSYGLLWITVLLLP